MTTDDQLLFESRTRPRQGIIAALAGLLIAATSIIGLLGPKAAVDELTLGLLTDHRRGLLDIVSAVVNALAQVALASTLVYLYRLCRARRPEAPGFVPWLAVAGAVVTVVCVLANAIVLHIKVDDFVSSGAQTYDQASHLTGGTLLLALQVGTQFGSLLVAIAVCIIALQAMRVGLLPRAMGYIGIFAGALIIIPIIVIPVVQLYWLFALGYLMSGRWPSGFPSAWQTGTAQPWPSGAEMRAQRATAAQGRRGRGAAAEPIPAVDGPGDAEIDQSRTRANTPKRKRKRRS